MAYFGCINKSVSPPPEPVYYAKFTGQGYIELPVIVEDKYSYFVDFKYENTQNYTTVFGNSTSLSAFPQLTVRDNMFRSSDGTNNFNFNGNLNDRHYFFIDRTQNDSTVLK